jgi:ATP-dependent DNA helicase PIF1
VPIELDANMVCNYQKQSGLSELLRQCSLAIWDEATLGHRFMLEAIDLTLQDVCSKEATLTDETTTVITVKKVISRKRKRTDSQTTSFRNPEFTMGNTVTVMSGDFRQILPIIPRGSRAQTVNASLKKSILWPQVSHFSTTVQKIFKIFSNKNTTHQIIIHTS